MREILGNFSKIRYFVNITASLKFESKNPFVHK